MKRLFDFAWMFALLLGLLAANPPARADGIVLTVQGGYAMAGDTGLDNIGPWNRDVSLGDGYVFGGGVQYETGILPGFRIRGGVGANQYAGFDGDSSFSQPVWGNVSAVVGNNGEVSSTTLTFDADVDVMVAAYKGNGFAIYPTVGGSVGAAFNEVSHQSLFGKLTDGVNQVGIQCDGGSSNNTDVAWSVRGGPAIDIGEHISASVVYQYANLGSAETTDSLDCYGQINGQKVTNTAKVGVKSEDVNLDGIHSIMGRVSYRFSL